MGCNCFTALSSANRARARGARQALMERRRRYNRLYMRSWRADPRHQACEREHRERWHYERKLRNALRAHNPFEDDHGYPICGFCRKNPPVTKVLRLEIRDLSPRGYVEIRVPYCGQC
jgi:hypothetical protein